VIGVLVAVISVNVFSILTGIFGNGFQEYAEHKQAERTMLLGQLRYKKALEEVEAMPESPERVKALLDLEARKEEMTDAVADIQDFEALQFVGGGGGGLCVQERIGCVPGAPGCCCVRARGDLEARRG